MTQELYYILIYILLWIISFWTASKKGNGWTSSRSIILVHLVVSVLSLLLFIHPNYQTEFQGLTLFPFIYLFTLITISLIPVIKYDNGNNNRLIAPSMQFIKLFLISYVIISLVVLPSSFMNIREGIVLLLTDDTAGAALYGEAHGKKLSYSAFYGFCSAIHNCFFEVFVFFSFIYFCLKNSSKKLLWVVIVIIVLELLAPLASGLRTNTTMVFFTLINASVLFFPFLQESIRKVVKRMAIVLCIIVAVPFVLLTLSRFGNSDTGATGAVINYAGQAPLMFNLYCLDAGGMREGNRTCNTFKSMLGFSDVPNGVMETRMKYSNMPIDDGYFTTYVGDFVLDFGPYYAAILFIIISNIFAYITKRKRNHISCHQLLIVYCAGCISLQGSMYLFNYSFKGNYTIIAWVITYFLFRGMLNNGKILLIERKK